MQIPFENKFKKIIDYLSPLEYKKEIEKEIEKRNRADTYNMTNEDERETYRHILTSALFSRKYNPLIAEILGNAYESADFLKGKRDGKKDLYNNQLGRDFYKLNRDIPEDKYYDAVFNSFIVPDRAVKEVSAKIIQNAYKQVLDNKE